MLYPHYLRPFPSCSIVRMDTGGAAVQLTRASEIARDTQLPAEVREQLIEGAGSKIADSIEQIAQGLATKQAVAVQSDEEETLAGELEQMPDEIDENQRLVQTQGIQVGGHGATSRGLTR